MRKQCSKENEITCLLDVEENKKILLTYLGHRDISI